MDQNDFLRTASASKTRNRTGLIDILVRKKRFSLPETVSIRVLRTASPSQSIPEGVRNDSRLFRQAPFWSSMGVVPPTSSYSFDTFHRKLSCKAALKSIFLRVQRRFNPQLVPHFAFETSFLAVLSLKSHSIQRKSSALSKKTPAVLPLSRENL